MPNTITACAPGQRCGKARSCPYCSRIRQAKAADKAEAMHKWTGQLYFSVVRPIESTAEDIRRIRAQLLRKQIAGMGIWSIEKGEQFGTMHINLITPEPKQITIPDASIHIERISTSPRAAAAYILKLEGQPTLQQYEGRTYGTWGQIGQYLTTKEAAPIVQAAAINDLIQTPHTRQQTVYYNTPNGQKKQEPELTKEQYQALARKHLSSLYDVVNRQQNKHFGT